MELFDIQGGSNAGKNLNKLADFSPPLKEVSGSAIKCSEQPMEIKLKLKTLDVHYSRIPFFTDQGHFLGVLLSFYEKAERDVTPVNPNLEAKHVFEDILGNAPAIITAKNLAGKSAETSVNVLLSGDSGTGKEMFAQSIHNASSRKEQPFVAINCGAIARELAESELFGYDPGSFTGAKKEGKMGKIEAADKGTLFLDEIGDMPLEMQAKLLRVLESRTITRIGGTDETAVNIRVIAATNKDLQKMVQRKLFREDLYYRIAVTTITLPALKDCQEDIPELVISFVDYYSEQMGKHVKEIEFKLMESLKNYSWPGNIRELRNTIEFAVMLNSGYDSVTWEHLPGEMRMAMLYQAASEQQPRDPLRLEKEEIQKTNLQLYEKALKVSGGKVTEAAAILGISRATLYRKIKKYGLSVSKS